MRTAILIIGHIRTWSECKDNFIEAFGHLNPDVFVSTYNLQFNYHPAQQGWMGGQSDTILSGDDIISLFDGINLIGIDVEDISEVLAEYNVIKSDLNPKFNDETNTYLQYKKIKRAIEMLKMYEEQCGFKYDNIIKIRADIHHNKFEYEIDDKSVVISDGNVFPNDVIFGMTRDNFIKLSDFFISEFHNPVYADSHLKAPHNLLLRGFEHIGVDILEKNIMKYVVRKIGKHYYNNVK